MASFGVKKVGGVALGLEAIAKGAGEIKKLRPEAIFFGSAGGGHAEEGLFCPLQDD